MLPNFAASYSLVVFLCAAVAAQQPGGVPRVPGQAPAQTGDALRRALVEADGSRAVFTAAAEQLLASATADRVRFAAMLSAIAAVAPKVEPQPATKPDATPAPASAAPAGAEAGKPVEFSDATKQLMTTVLTGNDEASKAALAALTADKEAGSAALARLHERGQGILARGLLQVLRKKIDTGAIYAGQYDELKDLQPEAGNQLLRWAQVAPKEASRADDFRDACLRALRDVLPTEAATDATRDSLRGIAMKAQKAGVQRVFIAAVCALHQYGDPSIFDQLKASVEKQSASANEQEQTSAANVLADLHYQLRSYEDAATHYKAAVALLEKAAKPPQNLPTTMYNTACSLSLAKKTDEALQYLEMALQAGAKGRAISKTMIDADHDMNNLRSDPRFAELMEKFFGKAGSAGANPHGK